MAYRIESGRLDKAERTPQGGLRIPAAVGRSGCLEYMKADGSRWVEYRPADEAFAPASVASLRGAPVTELHPPRAMTPETFRAYSRGHVGDDPRQDGEHLAASLYVHDAGLIRGIERGDRQECSAGYEVDLEVGGGVAPDGTHYDAIQRNIRYNHVAIGPRGWGRAGSSVSLRLDSSGDVVGERDMKTERIDGVDLEVGSDSWAQARARFDASRETRLHQLEADLAAACKDRDKAVGRADALAKELDPGVLRARVQARVALERAAASVKPDLRLDDMSDRAVMLAVLSLDDKTAGSDDYLRGRFESVVESAAKADGGLAKARATMDSASAPAPMSTAEAARRRSIAINRHMSAYGRES